MPRAEAGGGHPSRLVRAGLLLLTWLCLTGLLIGTGELVVHTSAVADFDRHVTTAAVAHRSPALDAVMKAVTWLGSWVALLAAAAVVAALVLRRRLPVAFLVLAVAAWAGEAGGTTLAKHVVRRARPPERLWLVHAHGWSWPSGHTATAALVFAVLAAVVVLLVPGARGRVAAAVVAALAVLLVASSRVVLGVHWTSDTVASIVFVGAWLLVLAALFRLGPAHAARAGPSSGPSTLSAANP